MLYLTPLSQIRYIYNLKTCHKVKIRLHISLWGVDLTACHLAKCHTKKILQTSHFKLFFKDFFVKKKRKEKNNCYIWI